MKNITLLDGAVGTSLWELAEKAGIEKVPVWKYNMERPEMVTELHRRFIGAGAQMILANTFGANGPAVRRSSAYDPDEVVRAGVKLAKDAAKDSGVPVALSVGPLMQLMEPYGDLEEDEVAEIYRQAFEAGMSEGADLIMIQTFIDLGMMSVAAKEAKKFGVPVMCTLSFEKRGKTMMGNSVQDIIDELEPLGIDGIGMNCSLGPDLAINVIREFSEKTKLPLVFKPNAGKPILASDGSTVTDYDAKTFVREVAPALEFVDYVGGCCGCNWEYIRELAEKIKEN